MATEIQTFVFFDLEGTGLFNKPRITEISLLAVHRSSLQNAAYDMQGLNADDRCNFLPRVVNKLTVCINPMKTISLEAANLTGLYNDMLSEQKDFDDDLVSLLSMFLHRLQSPVCLISHNGFRFDFPLLKAELFSIERDLPEGLLCLDSWEMFRCLDGSPVLDRSQFIVSPKNSKKSFVDCNLPSEASKRKKKNHPFTDDSASVGCESVRTSCREVASVMENSTSLADVAKIVDVNLKGAISTNSESARESSTSEGSCHSTTSTDTSLISRKNQQMITENGTFSVQSKVAVLQDELKDRHAGNYTKKRVSYRLGEIHLRVLGCYPSGSHTAEDDCIALARIFMSTQNCTQWADSHAVPFSAFSPLYNSQRRKSPLQFSHAASSGP